MGIEENYGSSYVILFIIAGLYFLFDVAYVVRGMFVSVMWTLVPLLRPSKIMTPDCLRSLLLTPSSTESVCWFTDLDLMLHMNNARYLRECDFARFKLLCSSGIAMALRRSHMTMVLGGSTIRYRRSIDLFTRYRIETKALAWDERSLYFESKFVRTSDDFVCAVILTKQALVSGDLDRLFKTVLVLQGNKDQEDVHLESPPFPEELRKWIESNAVSSQKLNPRNKNRFADAAVENAINANRLVDTVENTGVSENTKDADPESTRRRKVVTVTESRGSSL